MNILLTGASGFLGSALALDWLRAGHQVALLVRPSSQLQRLGGFDASFNIGRCSSDIEVADFIRQVQPVVVVHTACAYGRGGESHLELFDANLRLGLVILQALQELGRPVNFINTGSALAPEISPYSLSKHQFAQWGRILAMQAMGKIAFTNVLLQHMYGPHDDLSKFTTHLMHACHRNDQTIQLTAGEQTRDFIYIDDVVSAYSILLAECTNLGEYLEIDVGSGVAPTIRQLVETVHRLTGSHSELLFGSLPYRKNEAMHCLADVQRIKQLGWKPRFDLESGLKKTIELEFKK